MSGIKAIARRMLISVCNIFLIPIIFFPRTTKIIVFGSWFGERFADNSRALFLNLHLHREDNNYKKIIFITRNEEIYTELKNKNINVLMMHSIKSYYFQLRSKIHVVDQSYSKDLLGYLNIGAYVINLWHGVPLKKIGGYYNRFWKNRFLKFIDLVSTPGFSRNNFVLCTSIFHMNLMMKEFHLKENQCILSAYPRVVGLIDNEFFLDQELIYREALMEHKKTKKIIGYFPTFRDNSSLNLFGETSDNVIKDFLKEKYEKDGYIFLTKLHSADSTKVANYPHLINLNAKVDLYSVIDLVDILITDYSSIYFDYLILNRPIFFMPYDIDIYSQSDRGFLLNYEDFTPGPKVYNLSELSSSLRNYDETLESIYSRRREVLAAKIFEFDSLTPDLYKKLRARFK